MIHCPVRIESRSTLQQSASLGAFEDSSGNIYEREAKYYYQSKGYKVIRLEHFASAGVGSKEDILPESKILGNHLRKYLPPDTYQTFIRKSKASQEALVLNGVSPKDYSLSFYPPDFLVIDITTNIWKFVEVKGPTDKLHFRQANWYINLLPNQWEYEIFASVNIKFEDSYICNIADTREGIKFQNEYSNKIDEVNKWNTMMKNRK